MPHTPSPRVCIGFRHDRSGPPQPFAGLGAAGPGRCAGSVGRTFGSWGAAIGMRDPGHLTGATEGCEAESFEYHPHSR